MDEFFLTVVVPRGLRADVYQTIRRTLTGRRFRTRLQNGLRDVVRRFPSLAHVQVTLSR
jgi:hypothetical protein